MPLYEYQCDACAHRFERIQKFSDPLVDTCPTCGGQVRKLLSSPAFQFKGTGFYITDYPKKSASDAAKGDAEKSDSKASDSKASDSKSTESSSNASDSSASSASTATKAEPKSEKSEKSEKSAKSESKTGSK